MHRLPACALCFFRPHRLQIAFIAFFSYLLLLSSTLSAAVEFAPLVTYGAAAEKREGDEDFIQFVDIRVPTDRSAPVHLKIFDADCGGTLDARYSRRWDTVTRFRVEGGRDAVLADVRFGENSDLDGRWTHLASLSPAAGVPEQAYFRFRVTIEGISGDDGNRFLLRVTDTEAADQPAEGVRITAEVPTIHLPRRGIYAELRFFVPDKSRALLVHNFDAAEAVVGVDTPFRKNLPVPSSTQGLWAHGTVALRQRETGRMCAVRFMGGREIPNDATFFVFTENGRRLPIELPVVLQTPNRSPRPVFDIRRFHDCRIFNFDASATTDPENDPITYLWDFGDGETAEGPIALHRYDWPGTFTGSLTTRNPGDRVANGILRSFTVTVNHPPKAVAGPDLAAAPGDILKFDASGSRDIDGQIRTYRWDFGNGVERSGRIVRYAYPEAGRYTVVLTVTDDSDTPCGTDSDTEVVTINAAPVPDPGSNRAAAAGEAFVFSGRKSRDPDGRIVAYQWNFGDGSSQHGDRVVHTYTEPGRYRVTLTVTDDSGLKNAVAAAHTTVVVNRPPVAEAGPDRRAAPGETLAFSAAESEDKDGKIIRYAWDFGDGEAAAGPGVEHAFSAPGRYQVILRVTDDSGTTTATTEDHLTVIVNAPPVAEAGPDRRVTADPILFDASASRDPDGKITRYLWDFGDGTTAEGISPTHVYRFPGEFRVRLRVFDDSGTSNNQSQDTATVIVNEPPIADAGPDKTVAPFDAVTFNAGGSLDPDGEITGYRWEFGDGGSAEGKRVEHRFEKPGRYTALLIVSDDSEDEDAVGFDETVVIVNHAPTAHAGDDILAAPGDEIHLNAEQSTDPDGRLSTIRWDVTDAEGTPLPGSPFSGATHRVTIPAPGIYTALLTVVDAAGVNNSTDTDQITIRINHPPRPDPGPDRHTHLQTLRFDATGSSDPDNDPLLHFWDFGDGSPPRQGVTVLHTYEKGGVYPVVLTVDDQTGLSNARASASVVARINEPPVADAGSDRTVCAGKITLFDGDGSVDPERGALKFHWDFGDGTEAFVVNPSKVYPKGGEYAVTLTVTDDSGLSEGSRDTDRILVRVIESPVADAGENKSACAGAVIRFDGTGSTDVDGVVNNYHWDFGDGQSAGGPTPNHVYTEPGRYRVLLTVTGDDAGECPNTDTDDLVAVVMEAPTVEIEAPAAAVIDAALPLAGKQLGGPPVQRWHWDFGDGRSATGKQVSHRFGEGGDYIVRLNVETNVDALCRSASARKRITINRAPVAEAGPDRVAAAGETIFFDGSASRDPDGVITRFAWDFGDGESGAGAAVVHRYTAAGRYDAVLTVFDNTELANNRATDRVAIVVNAAPTPVITAPEVVCAGVSSRFSAGDSYDEDGEIAAYEWRFGDGVTAEGKTVDRVFQTPGVYDVILSVDDGTAARNARARTLRRVRVEAPLHPEAGPDRVVSPEERVSFTARHTPNPEDVRFQYKWDFGNNQAAEGEQVDIVYKKPGTYTVRLLVDGGADVSCRRASDAAKVRVNAPPVADAGGDKTAYTGGANDQVVFNAGRSSDPDGDPLTYTWDFGDNTTGSGKMTTHAYRRAGRYRVTLTVDDGLGLSSSRRSDSITVVIKER